MVSVETDPDQLHRRAVEFVNQGRLREARDLLDAASRSATDADLRARVEGTRAIILVRTGSPEEAEQVCEAAMSIPGLQPRSIALLAGQLGSVAERLGKLDVAERWLTQGIDGLSEFPAERANLLVNRSLVNIHRRSVPAAAADAAAATEIFSSLGEEIDAAQARHNEGYIRLLGGDLVSALTEMVKARATLVGVSPVMAAIGDLDRAEVLREAGQTTEAERILRQVAEVFGSQGMPQSRAEAEFQLARSLLSHDIAAAESTARAAARRFRRLGIDLWATRSEGVRLQAALQSGRVEYRGSTAAVDRRLPGDARVAEIVKRLERYGLRGEARELRLTRLLSRARRGHSDAGLIRVSPTDPLEVRILAYEVRAERASARAEGGATRKYAAAGLDLLAEWQGAFGSIDLQTSASMHAAGLMYRGLASAVDSGRPEVVFDWSERARHMNQQVVPLRPPPDRELADDLAEIRLVRADDPSGDWISSSRVAELRERVRERQWAHTGARAGSRRVSLDEAQAGLSDSAALLSYVFTGTSMVATVITSAGARLVPVALWPEAARLMTGLRADLDMAASVRSGPLQRVVARTLDERLAELSRILLDEPLRGLDVERVILTVPGVLNSIPWAMLPAMRARPFAVAVSATRWLSYERDARRAPPARTGFVLGPRVARAHEEVKTAAEAWDRPKILGAATASAVTRLAGEVDVLHIAAHGRHAVDNPMFSGLELADGTLFGYDIDLIENVPDTVILSACEVGRSSVRWGEEAVGMTRVWLHAGARCVVAAPVVVADDDACELLAAMHDGLAAGIPPSVALAEASQRTGIVAPFQVHGAGF
ncbi:CHAT domain-containing protein [Microbacterium jejuense]|uniref:CHAT domain-containing protein n=1 Tax=Microbacterium jejuense TaxID=1263637 RepID=UPI003CD07619